MRSKKAHSDLRSARGFTLVEVLVAGVIAAFIIGSISMTVGQLARTKNSSRARLTAHLRADSALSEMRADIASVIRDSDLFYTQLMIIDDVRDTPVGEMDRDEVLLFNTRFRAVRDLSYQGEGMEYESYYRVEEDRRGPVLWQRRDPVPDRYTLGGGRAIPAVEGIVGISFEAYDGLDWFQQWDSDEDGLPVAVRITVVASGHTDDEDLATAPLATLRTVVPIDRLVPPRDWLFPTPEEELEHEQYLDELLANFGQTTNPNNQGQQGIGGNIPPDGNIEVGPGAEVIRIDPNSVNQPGRRPGRPSPGSGGSTGGVSDDPDNTSGGGRPPRPGSGSGGGSGGSVPENNR